MIVETKGSYNNFRMNYYRGKVVTVLSYSSLAFEEADRLRENGIDVVIGLREDRSNEEWIKNGFQTFSIWDAVKQGDIIQVW